MHRSYIRESTKDVMERTAHYNEKRKILDPNTNQPIQDEKVIGHPSGLEWHGFESYGDKSGMSQAEMNEIQNNGCMLQWESNSSNGQHSFEEQDPNATALNTANYCYLENPQYQETTFINPPSAEGEQWTLTVENVQTGIESQAAIHSAVSSYSSELSVSYDNDMSDFGVGDYNADTMESSVSEEEGDVISNSDDGMTI